MRSLIWRWGGERGGEEKGRGVVGFCRGRKGFTLPYPGSTYQSKSAGPGNRHYRSLKGELVSLTSKVKETAKRVWEIDEVVQIQAIGFQKLSDNQELQQSHMVAFQLKLEDLENRRKYIEFPIQGVWKILYPEMFCARYIFSALKKRFLIGYSILAPWSLKVLHCCSSRTCQQTLLRRKLLGPPSF